ncbi:MAG: hypothetical protein KAW52_00295 [candidate division Zixibacteria bacterium]|nr:hypothetical protein [candidate division Zixibacteria bacterium]
MIIIPRKIKDWLPLIVGICALVVLIFFGLQITKANRFYNKYLIADADFQSKNTAYIELKRETDREKIILVRERDEEAQARKESDKEIKEIRAAGRQKDRELVKAKAKIKELTPDQLTIQLNARVPGQYALLSTEDFSLTRYGGEATLGLFMDGERCTVALSERDSEIEEYKIKEISFNKDRKNFKVDLTATEKLVSDCDTARLAAINAKEDLHKAFKAMKWKQFGKGAVGGGLLVVVILKIAGVI